MAVMRRGPFRGLITSQERMNRLFEDANRGWRAEEASATRAWSSAVDIFETEEEIIC